MSYHTAKENFMNQLPLPKETREKKPWTTFRQLKYGLVVFLLCTFLADFLDKPVLRLLGTCSYAASFSVIPLVPEHITKESVRKKFKRNLRILGAVMVFYAVFSFFKS